jgi:type I restriction enzyme M protein
MESGYNLDIKNPNTPDDGPGDPEKLLVEYQELLGAIGAARDALKNKLAEALERQE